MRVAIPKGALFFFLFLADSGFCMRSAVFEKKKVKKEHTEHERMHVFGTLSARGIPYKHAPHTDREGSYLFGSDIHTCTA